MPAARKVIPDQHAGTGQEVHDEGIQQVSWGNDKRGQSSVRRKLRSSEIQVSPGFVNRNQRTETDDISALKLFSETNTTRAADGNELMNDLPTPKDSDLDVNAEEAEADLFTGTVSARRAARLLRSRFQARRERAAQRSASAAGTQPSLATEQ